MTRLRVQGKAWADKRSLCAHRLQGTVFVSAAGRGPDKLQSATTEGHTLAGQQGRHEWQKWD